MLFLTMMDGVKNPYENIDNKQDAFIYGDWASEPFIDIRCLNYIGIYCQACSSMCTEQAIVFDGPPDKLSRPTIDPEKCKACKLCVSVCPADSIHIN